MAVPGHGSKGSVDEYCNAYIMGKYIPTLE
jgi:hypothetical protein